MNNYNVNKSSMVLKQLFVFYYIKVSIWLRVSVYFFEIQTVGRIGMKSGKEMVDL